MGKVALREVTPFVLASFRAVLGALLLSLLARALSGPAPEQTLRERGKVAVLSFCGIVANQVLFIVGLSLTSAIHATLLTATIPIFTLVVATLSGRERPTLLRAAGIPVALGGIVFLLDPGEVAGASGSLLGDLLLAANAAFYSVFLVASREVLARRSALSFVAQAFRYGALPILLVASGDLGRFRPAAVTGTGWLAIAGVVAFATVGAYALNAWALARTSASTTALFVYVQPVFATALAALVLGERVTPRLLGAAALIFAGVALATVRRGPRRPAS